MGKTTGIPWCDHTFNSWIGCVEKSDGCKNCYAKHDTFPRRERSHGCELWGASAIRHITSNAYWRQPLAWDREAERAGVMRSVFCGSLCDVFEARDDLIETRYRLWNLIEQTPHLRWLLLTKRPENIEGMLPAQWSSWGYFQLHGDMPKPYTAFFPPNVWLGVTAENSEQFMARWPMLENIGRRWYVPVLFISAEPLLGPINMADDLTEFDEHEEDNTIWVRGIDWVIVGGESGPHARPMHPQWARSLRDQCAEAEVPFFFKQHGEWLHESQFTEDAQREAGLESARMEAKDGFQFVRVGKKLAGDLLDGREHKEFPQS